MNPHCCEPNASRKTIETLTGWLADVRRLTEARSRRIGKPVPLGLRVPGNLGYLRSIRIDVADLARRGVIDFVSFSNFWQTSWDMPYERLRAELGNDVAIYCCVEDAPNWVSGMAPNLVLEPGTAAPSYSNLGIRYLSASPELLRGNAAGKLAMGVDGIETFNFFCTDQVKIPGFGATTKLCGRSKILRRSEVRANTMHSPRPSGKPRSCGNCLTRFL